MNNPLHLWQVWRGDVWLQRACLAKHNAIMDEKMDRIMAHPPPDYTIAGQLVSMHSSIVLVMILVFNQRHAIMDHPMSGSWHSHHQTTPLQAG
jgi:hypothetical protein